jgi:hypothetical protein
MNALGKIGYGTRQKIMNMLAKATELDMTNFISTDLSDNHRIMAKIKDVSFMDELKRLSQEAQNQEYPGGPS